MPDTNAPDPHQAIATAPVVADNDNHKEPTTKDFARELTRKLNRRGSKLRVRRRRGDTNAIYAAKQLAEVHRRLWRAQEHVAGLLLEATDCQRLLAHARSNESSPHHEATP